MNSQTYNGFFRKRVAKFVMLFIYLIAVNLLAGYCAIWLRYPSLWGGSNVFLEYAMPIGMTWGLSHWPSMVLTSIPLLLVPHWNVKQVNRFRIICIGLILVLLYGVIEQVPFALFPAVDLFTALFLSLIIAPPNYKDNPALTITMALLISISTLYGIYYLYSKWQHRTPVIKESVLMSGLYKLKAITVENNYRKKMLFTTELTRYIEPDSVCSSATEMTNFLFDSYPFDVKYNKTVEIFFNPDSKGSDFSPYPLGQMEQYEESGETLIACYIKYKQ